MVSLPVGGAQTHQSREAQTSSVVQSLDKAEVSVRTTDVVDERSLAQRVGALGGRVTEIVTELGTTDKVGISVSLVGNTRWV